MKRYVTVLTGLAAFAAATSSIGAGPVRAEEGVFMKRLLSDLGVIDDVDAATIDYRERAPLVVPPKIALPPPAAAGSARPPVWPQDPDIVKHKAAVVEAQKPVPHPGANATSSFNNARLSPEELNGKRRVTAPSEAPGPRKVYGEGRLSTWVDPRELLGIKSEEEKSKLTYGQEPDRGNLTQPPPGYRLPANNASIAKTKDKPILKPLNDNNPEREFVKKPEDEE